MREWKELTRLNKCQVPTCQEHHVVLGFVGGGGGIQRIEIQVLQRPCKITRQVTSSDTCQGQWTPSLGAEAAGPGPSAVPSGEKCSHGRRHSRQQDLLEPKSGGWSTLACWEGRRLLERSGGWGEVLGAIAGV